MSLETDLRAYLLTQTPLTTLIAARIYIGRRPQGTASPAVAFRRVSDNRAGDIGAAAGYASARIQFDCFDRDFIDAKAVAEALRGELDGYSGTLNSITKVYSCWHAGEITLPIHLDDGADNHAFQIAVNFQIQFEETVPTF